MQCSTCNVKNAAIYNNAQITTERPDVPYFRDLARDSALPNNFVVASNTWCSKHNNGDLNCSICIRNPNVSGKIINNRKWPTSDVWRTRQGGADTGVTTNPGTHTLIPNTTTGSGNIRETQIQFTATTEADGLLSPIKNALLNSISTVPPPTSSIAHTIDAVGQSSTTGDGHGALFNLTTSGTGDRKSITNITVVKPGVGYKTDDMITFSRDALINAGLPDITDLTIILKESDLYTRFTQIVCTKSGDGYKTGDVLSFSTENISNGGSTTSPSPNAGFGPNMSFDYKGRRDYGGFFYKLKRDDIIFDNEDGKCESYLIPRTVSGYTGKLLTIGHKRRSIELVKKVRDPPTLFSQAQRGYISSHNQLYLEKNERINECQRLNSELLDQIEEENSEFYKKLFSIQHHAFNVWRGPLRILGFNPIMEPASTATGGGTEFGHAVYKYRPDNPILSNFIENYILNKVVARKPDIMIFNLLRNIIYSGRTWLQSSISYKTPIVAEIDPYHIAKNRAQLIKDSLDMNKLVVIRFSICQTNKFTRPRPEIEDGTISPFKISYDVTLNNYYLNEQHRYANRVHGTNITYYDEKPLLLILYKLGNKIQINYIDPSKIYNPLFSIDQRVLYTKDNNQLNWYEGSIVTGDANYITIKPANSKELITLSPENVYALSSLVKVNNQHYNIPYSIGNHVFRDNANGKKLGTITTIDQSGIGIITYNDGTIEKYKFAMSSPGELLLVKPDVEADIINLYIESLLSGFGFQWSLYSPMPKTGSPHVTPTPHVTPDDNWLTDKYIVNLSHPITPGPDIEVSNFLYKLPSSGPGSSVFGPLRGCIVPNPKYENKKPWTLPTVCFSPFIYNILVEPDQSDLMKMYRGPAEIFELNNIYTYIIINAIPSPPTFGLLRDKNTFITRIDGQRLIQQELASYVSEYGAGSGYYLDKYGVSPFIHQAHQFYINNIKPLLKDIPDISSLDIQMWMNNPSLVNKISNDMVKWLHRHSRMIGIPRIIYGIIFPSGYTMTFNSNDEIAIELWKKYRYLLPYSRSTATWTSN